MASTSELKDALVESMTYSGAMARIRARVRAEIAHALDVGDASHDVHSDTTTKVPFETTFIHELVREYLRFHNLRDTAGVFVPEAGMADAPPFDRAFMARRLGVPDDAESQAVPLLYALVERSKAWASMPTQQQQQQQQQQAAIQAPPSPEQPVAAVPRRRTTRYDDSDDDSDSIADEVDG